MLSIKELVNYERCRRPVVTVIGKDTHMFGAGKNIGGFGPGGAGFGGWGGPGIGTEWGGADSGGPKSSDGWGDGPGFGGAAGPDRPGAGGPFKKAAVVAGLLLDGPADAAEVAKRLSTYSHGAVQPPTERVELLLAVMAGKGVVTLDNGVATLTELGRNLLAWRGVNADTARALLAQAEKFGDVFKIRRELKATADLARTITWTGTDEQKKVLKKARALILSAINEAKRALHESLAAEANEHSAGEHTAAVLSDDELRALRAILAKLAA